MTARAVTEESEVTFFDFSFNILRRVISLLYCTVFAVHTKSSNKRIIICSTVTSYYTAEEVNQWEFSAACVG